MLMHHMGTKGSIVVCISPLIALMMDREAKFNAMGVGSIYCCNRSTMNDAASGKAQFRFISPESFLRSSEFRDMLLSSLFQKQLVTIVVDEAHCIKTWLVHCVIMEGDNSFDFLFLCLNMSFIDSNIQGIYVWQQNTCTG